MENYPPWRLELLSKGNVRLRPMGQLRNLDKENDEKYSDENTRKLPQHEEEIARFLNHQVAGILG